MKIARAEKRLTRIVVCFLAVVILLTGCQTFSVQASEEELGCVKLKGVYYKYEVLEGKEAEIYIDTDQNKTLKSTIEIPSKINGYKVVKIGVPKGKGYNIKNSVKKVLLPDTITVIDKSAFWGFSGLQEIKLPKNLKTICSYAFAYTENLEYINIPNTVTRINTGAFSESGLVEIDLSELKLKEFGKEVFSDCRRLQSVKMPNSIKTLGDSTFSGCKKLTSVKLPSKLQYIEYECFANTKISRITLPKTLKKIGQRAFYKTPLEEITIPEKCELVESGAFESCTRLKRLTYGKNTKIDRDAVYYTPQLGTTEKDKLDEGDIKNGQNYAENSIFYLMLMQPDLNETIKFKPAIKKGREKAYKKEIQKGTEWKIVVLNEKNQPQRVDAESKDSRFEFKLNKDGTIKFTAKAIGTYEIELWCGNIRHAVMQVQCIGIGKLKTEVLQENGKNIIKLSSNVKKGGVVYGREEGVGYYVYAYDEVKKKYSKIKEWEGTLTNYKINYTVSNAKKVDLKKRKVYKFKVTTVRWLNGVGEKGTSKTITVKI